MNEGRRAKGDGRKSEESFRLLLSLWILLCLLCGESFAAQTVTHPFEGVTLITRDDSTPRPVKMHVLVIDTQAPGIRFLVTPHGGKRDTLKQTTLAFLTERKAQIAVNGHFFEPWPPPNPDPGTAELVGLAASNGNVYSPFKDHPPKDYAIRPDAPALNIDEHNVAAIVHCNKSDPSRKSVEEPVTLYNAVAGNEQILTRGAVTAGTGKWDNTPGPLTVIGLKADGKMVILIVDGRQPRVSEGLSTREAAGLLARDYQVADAINLDGGGSTTLCLADPAPRVVNVTVGINNVPGTLRPVGSNLAIFATPTPTAGGERDIALPVPLLWGGLCVMAVVLVVGLWRVRRRPGRRAASSETEHGEEQ
ncbi:MAG: phosphodiester glycosidase family protein [Methanoregula sp.]|uniref:phosphodiester glycosidase family protein n=1 Tax=Methanoregula sp. TaxID=2052170 RepID=UPI003FD88E16